MVACISGGRLVARFVRGIPPEYLWNDITPKDSRGRFEEPLELIMADWTHGSDALLPPIPPSPILRTLLVGHRVRDAVFAIQHRLSARHLFLSLATSHPACTLRSSVKHQPPMPDSQGGQVTSTVFRQRSRGVAESKLRRKQNCRPHNGRQRHPHPTACPGHASHTAPARFASTSFRRPSSKSPSFV